MAILSVDKICHFSFIILFLPLSIFSDDFDKCIKQSACKCEFENGTGIDLSPSAGSIFYSADSVKPHAKGWEINTYFFHPCSDASLAINTTELSGTCKDPISVCRHRLNVTSTPTDLTMYTVVNKPYEGMGAIKEVAFTNDGRSLIYQNGPSTTTVLLVCTTASSNKLTIFSEEDPRNIELAYYSPDACMKEFEDAHQRSVGSILLIIFFVLVITYLILGILTKKYLMGAQGIEVVPNLGFWMDLPNLVKDGIDFIRNGFKVTPTAAAASPDQGSNPRSYETI